LVSELRLTAGCVLMDLASPAVSGTSVYANGLNDPVLNVLKLTIFSSNSTLTQSLKFLQNESVICAYHSLKKAEKYYSN